MEQDILIKKAIKGDADAFTELIKSNKVYLYKIAYSYVKNEQTALDILQESTYKAFINIKKLNKPAFFKTWVTKIIINEALNTIRKDKNIVSINEDTPLHNEQNTVSIEEKLDLYNALDNLRDNYKTVILLKYFNSLSVENISYIMDIPQNTVKSHLKRAKESLSKILKEDYLHE
jgi:RNA polymerase sigma-70 factor (ECF subfamily)